MEMADYWIIEKEYIHKLFKVLVPRYQDYTVSYTRLIKAPTPYQDLIPRPKAVLELRGNPYPSLLPDTHNNRALIHNVLLDEAKKAYRQKKYSEIAAKIDAAEQRLIRQSTESGSVNKSASEDASVNSKSDS